MDLLWLIPALPVAGFLALVLFGLADAAERRFCPWLRAGKGR